MDTYLENYIYSECRGFVNDNLFNSSLLQKKNPSIDAMRNNTRKPLRGWGRYMPNLNAPDESILESVRLKEQGSLKGMGRKQNFYSDLVKLLNQNKPDPINRIKKAYTYWRGAGRPKQIVTTSEYS
jgi:hypothetical protein